MKAFTCGVIIGGVSTKVDGGLSIRIITPELSPQEKAAVFELQNTELKMLLQQESEGHPKLTDCKTEFDTKTPSQRLRAVIFVLYKNAGQSAGEFEEFYRRRMESIINMVKEQLPEQT